ncbi:MAG: hypothetical protein WAX69_22265 [Victivallales bacterium]
MMKEKAKDGETLYKPEKSDFAGWEESSKAMERNWSRFRKMDAEAKSKGEILGRYISEPYADSAANYQIIAVTGGKAMVLVCTGLGDDWVIPYWGRCAAIDRRYAEESIRRRDGIRELFRKRDQDDKHK